jgi:hypothetical protein
MVNNYTQYTSEIPLNIPGQCLQDGSYNGRLLRSKTSQLNSEATIDDVHIGQFG